MSPVLQAISLHLDAVAPNFLIQERLYLADWRADILAEPLKLEEGFLPVPQGPGWGVELNEELCRRHPRIAAGTPSLYRADGSICDW